MARCTVCSSNDVDVDRKKEGHNVTAEYECFECGHFWIKDIAVYIKGAGDTTLTGETDDLINEITSSVPDDVESDNELIMEAAI